MRVGDVVAEILKRERVTRCSSIPSRRTPIANVVTALRRTGVPVPSMGDRATARDDLRTK
jgi:hypothetical protein